MPLAFMDGLSTALQCLSAQGTTTRPPLSQERRVVCFASTVRCLHMLLTALPALLLRFFSQTRLSHPSSDQGSFLHRQQHCLWMIGQKGRGSLFRLEEERPVTKGLAHALAGLVRQDKRHDEALWRQVLDSSFRGGHKGNGIPGMRAARSDVGAADGRPPSPGAPWRSAGGWP